MNYPPPMQQFRPQKKSGIGTVGMVFIIIGAIVFALLVGGGLMLYSTVKDIGNKLEPTSRVTTYIPTEKDKLTLKRKLAELRKVQQSGGEYTLVVTPSDINTYISSKATDKNSKKPRFKVDIQGNTLSGIISIPIADKVTGKIKYFNGEGKFTAAVNAGKLDVRLQDVLIKGAQPPFLLNIVINQFKKENLAEEIYRNPARHKLREQLAHCKKLQINAGKILLTLQFPVPATNNKNAKTAQQINAKELKLNRNHRSPLKK